MSRPGQLLRRLGWVLMVVSSVWFLASLAARVHMDNVFQGMLPSPEQTQGTPDLVARVASALMNQRPQQVAVFATVVFACGIILWWIGYERYRRVRKAQVFGEAAGVVPDDVAEQLRGEMLSLCAQYRGLPPIPIDPLEYERWIVEVRQAVRAKKLPLTAAQETSLLEQLSSLEGARLDTIQIEKQLRQALADLTIVRKNAELGALSSDKAEAHQAELCLENTESKMEQIHRELRMLKDHRRQSVQVSSGDSGSPEP